LEVDVQQGNFKIDPTVTSSNSHFFLVEKWNPPTRSETAKIGPKTEGILGVKGFHFFGLIFKSALEYKKSYKFLYFLLTNCHQPI
jgi:hypothetical protein